MTPKEKAKDLVERYSIWNWTETVCNYEGAKQCALIAVEEILNSGKDVDEFADAYWQEVKNEIKKL